MKMWKVVKQFFKCSIAIGREDQFVWALAEALLWRDEEVSMGAVPTPIKEQPEAARYYDDALYLIKHVTDRWNEE
jgi:hypothetical protein